MSAAAYKYMDTGALVNGIVRLQKEMVDQRYEMSLLEPLTSDNSAIMKLGKLKLRLEENEELKKAAEAELETKFKANAGAENLQNQQSSQRLSPPTSSVNAMTNHINTRVVEFDPTSVPVSSFLSDLRNAYEVYITGDTKDGALLEEYFIRAAKSRMTSITLENLSCQGKSTFGSFKEFCQVLTDEYADLSTGFQMLSSVWEMSMRDNESLTAFATRMNRQMAHSGAAIIAKFKKAKNVDSMSAQEAFNMVAGLRFLDFVRDRHPDVHRQMAGTSLNNHFSVTEIANEANRLVSMLKGSATSQTLHSRPGGSQMQRRDNQNANRGRNNNRRSDNRQSDKTAGDDKDKSDDIPDCNYGRMCTRRHKCQYKHPPSPVRKSKWQKKKSKGDSQNNATSSGENGFHEPNNTVMEAMSESHDLNRR